MKLNKLFELATTSALLLTQSPSITLAETIKPEDPLVNRIEYTQINETNPLQEIKSMPESSKAILVQAMRNARVNLLIDGGNPSSGALCLDKAGKENVIAVLHGIISKKNRNLLRDKVENGEIQQLTPSLRSTRENQKLDSDFQIVIPINVFRSLGGSFEGFRKLKDEAKIRSDYLKTVLPVEPDYLSSLSIDKSEKTTPPDCNFAVQSEHSNSINTDITINQHGELKQDGINNRLLTYRGDSGGAAMSLTSYNKPVFTNYVYSVFQENPPEMSDFDPQSKIKIQNRKHVNMLPNQLG
jgi:hypothetical protein